MTWEEFYPQYAGLDEQQLYRAVDALHTFGPVHEVAKAALQITRPMTLNLFLQRAVAHGVRFAEAPIVAFCERCSAATAAMLLRDQSLCFTEQQLDRLGKRVSNELLLPFWYKLPASNNRPEAKQARRHYDPEQGGNDPIGVLRGLCELLGPPILKLGCGALLFSLGLTAAAVSWHKQSCRKPHYGYRYGRWYYGFGHRYGCREDPKKTFGCSE